MAPDALLRSVRSNESPAPVGPYSQSTVHQASGLLFASGQIPLDPATGKIVAGDIEAQVDQVIANLRAVVEAAGGSLERVVRTTVYLVDLSVFPRVNAVYAKHFTGDPPPARATIEVSALPLGAQVEIDLVAALG